MAFPATAQAFKNQLCSLGVKEQMNGNTHFIDLSGLYGSTVRMADALRGENGLLKSTRRFGTKHELPPGQREGKSCTDATQKRKCFAGGLNRKNSFENFPLIFNRRFTFNDNSFIYWYSNNIFTFT
jgi:hypothetical protein